jgi:hypothetical protein
VSVLGMTTTRPAFFTIPAVLLTASMGVFIWLVLGFQTSGEINPYASSYEARIELYRSKLDSLNKIRSVRERIYMRQLANLEIPEYIVAKMRPTDVVLLPPRGYANRYMQTEAIWTDPRIFAWMVGFHNVVAWSDTARRSQANAFVVLDANAIWMTRPGGSTNIDSLLHVFARSE